MQDHESSGTKEMAGACGVRLISIVQNSWSKLAIRVTVAIPRSDAHLGQRRTTDYATVLPRLPEISNDLEVVRLL